MFLRRWHILTPEFPPECGGVGDYTALLAAALASAGDEVRVWHPRRDTAAAVLTPAAAGESGPITVTVLPDRFGAASRSLMTRAFAEQPGTVLVQYVPSAFGARGSNIAACRWLLGLGRRGADVRVMFHEPYFYFGLHRPWRNVPAVAQRVMAAILIRASRVIYLSTERWIEYLSPYGRLPPVEVLPIPATIPVEALPSTRTSPRSPELLVGHFGTFGTHIARPLAQMLPRLLEALPSARLVLIGEGGDRFRDGLGLPAAQASRVRATGRVSAPQIAAALRDCTVLVQPYPDGATTRRTSLMACLTSGRPVVTSDGRLTERVWRETRGVALTPAGDGASLVDAVVRLSADPAEAEALGARGRALYDNRFAFEHTIAALRGAAGGAGRDARR